DTVAVAPRMLNTAAVIDKFIIEGYTERDNPINIISSATTDNDYYDYGASAGQIKIHNGNFLHNYGFRGEGMQLAMSDAGFYHYKTLITFDSVRLNNQILGTYDFVTNLENVNNTHNHGSQCLSTIAANLPGVFVGTAPKSSFYLFRTEDAAVEYPVEEHMLAASYERADSLGVDVTSTSLGYSRFDNPIFNHTYSELDGKTTMAAIASNFGAKKGMIMVASAGNDGDNSWHYLATPADASLNIAVGAVSVDSVVASFSGYGPNSAGEIKPGLASVGLNAAVASTNTGLPIFSNGTSFAGPNLAGLITCLWQAFPEVNNAGIFNTLKLSASKSTNPDDRVGYGIPDMKKSFTFLVKQLFNSDMQQTGCENLIRLNVKLADRMQVRIERKTTAETEFSLINTIIGDGDFSKRQLNYTDNISQLPQGIIQYRFSMDVGNDTTFVLGSQSFNYLQSCNFVEEGISINPNPVVSDLNVFISRNEPIKFEVKVYNSLGQLALRKIGANLSGRNVTTLPFSKLSKGIYYVIVYVDGKKIYTKPVLRS
ncbi:MAG: S8 family serine peptidase, partial [Ferruginibacter sp.]